MTSRNLEVLMSLDLSIPPEALQRVQVLCDNDFVPRLTRATMLGLSIGQYCRYRKRLGLLPVRRTAGRKETARAKTRATRKPASSKAPSWSSLRSRAAPIDRIAVGRAMERFIAGRVAFHEAATGEDPEPERTARTVAHYARALGLVRTYLTDLEKEESRHAEGPTRTLSELRDELRRHLERIWDEDEDAGGCGRAHSESP